MLIGRKIRPFCIKNYGKKFEKVQKFKYLEQIITEHLYCDNEIMVELDYQKTREEDILR